VNWTTRISRILIALTCFLVIAAPVQAVDWFGDDGEDFQGMCKFVGAQQSTCESCAASQGVWTAIGCVPATQAGLFDKIFTVGLGMAGGIAFLLILFGGFQILSSAGNPEQLNEGRELVSSAVAGLLLIIFSVFLLRLIGYDILRIPGFGP
jgi:hypothetical protein